MALLLACALLSLPIIFSSLFITLITGGTSLYLGLAGLMVLVILAMLFTILRHFRRK